MMCYHINNVLWCTNKSYMKLIWRHLFPHIVHLRLFLLGACSGTSFGVLSVVTTVFLHDIKYSLISLGILSARMLPFSFKSLSAPFTDIIPLDMLFPKKWCMRKRWMFLLQIMISLSMIAIPFMVYNECVFFAFTLLQASMCATFDNSLEAFRLEAANNYEIPKVDLYFILGWTTAISCISFITLNLVSIVSWNSVYAICGFLCSLYLIVIYKIDDAIVTLQKKKYEIASFIKEYCGAFTTFLAADKAVLILLLVATFKLSDGFMDVLLMPFLLENGFSKEQLATFNKIFGTIGFLTGTVIGSYILRRFFEKTIHILLAAEIMAAFSNLLFLIFLSSSAGNMILGAISCLEKVCQGFANVAIISFMSMFCRAQNSYRATMFAILSSSSQLMRNIFSSFSGFIASLFGWKVYFVVSVLLSIPALFIVILLLKSNYQNKFDIGG
ncbi:Putative AmpG-like MFS transporter [Candidatus Fokinia solitaria]|uniref:AmpG-like MFS transporter n=2 Tax=Candidatus Fokinia solitaria TaxID=1802984 RepID=A0A2U8BSI6_9RICK|nr:Putative AmpG-like MFS transporter [Candidatus Fokinia solitaria]